MANTFCAITTKYIANPEGGADIEVKIAVYVKLNEVLQNSNGLCEAVGLILFSVKLRNESCNITPVTDLRRNAIRYSKRLTTFL